MESPFLTQAAARLRHLAANARPLPVLAGTLLLAAAVMHVWLLPGRMAAVEAAESRLAKLDRDLHRRGQASQPPGESPTAARERLLGRFQSEGRLHATLGRLLDLAREHGLRVSTGDYQLVAGKDGLLDSYVLNVPVNGGYLAIRRYLAAVRGEFLDLGVEDVSLRRENIDAAEVEARLRFVVFGRRGNP